MQNRLHRRLLKPVIATIIVAQLVLVINFQPPKANAIFGIADFTFTTEVGNVYDVLKDVGLGALRAVALQISNKFLTRLTNKLQDKYRIRNFLYYDKYLSDYYLEYVIADKISDPDLRRVFDMLYRGYVTGAPTGANANDPNAPDPRKALIPQLKKAMADYYIKQGGIPTSKIYNPGPNVSDEEYFATAQAYFANPPSFTEQNLQGQFGAFQSAATTASQAEVAVGNGLKAGRIIGGTCAVKEPGLDYQKFKDAHPDYPYNPYDLDSNGIPDDQEGSSPDVMFSDPSVVRDTVSCKAAGGVWEASALDVARSFIDNPTATIDKYLGGAIFSKLDANFNPNNFWAIIGSLLGDFLFNQLTLDRNSNDSGQPLPDYAGTYAPGRGLEDNDSNKGIDIDGDTIVDGYDTNKDGQLDVCVYGGVDDGSAGPPCKGSKAVLNPPVPEPCKLNLTVNNDVNSDPANGSASGSASGTVDLVCPPGGGDGGTGGDGPPAACTNLGQQEQDYMLPLLNDQGVAPAQVADMTNAQFSLQDPNRAVYYPNNNTIGLPEFYAAGPTAGRPVSPSTGKPWDIVVRCINAGGNGNHLDVVQAVKNALVAKGANLSGPCGAFMIVKNVAWRLRGEGAGLLDKPSGNNCQNYATDIIAYPDGRIYDILGDGGNTNNPSWNPDITDPSRYRPAIDPGADTV